MRLYCKENAQLRVVGFRSTIVSSVAGSIETLPDLVGKLGPMTPVTANGLKNPIDADRSPNPLPKKKAGEIVVKESAIRCAPVPPMSKSVPTERINSCGSFVRNCHFAPMPRLSQPFAELPSSALRCKYASWNSSPKFGSMRLE